jgi:hypothetical protein
MKLTVGPNIKPVMFNGQQVRVFIPANGTSVGAPPGHQPPVTLQPPIPPLPLCFQVGRGSSMISVVILIVRDCIQLATTLDTHVAARLTSNPTRPLIADTRVNFHGLDLGDDPAVTRETTASSRRVTPTFFLRHDNAGRVSEVQVEQQDLFEDTHDKWDKLLYCALTPSIDEILKHDFVLRLWRHPRWVDKRVSWKNGTSAAETLRATIDQIVEGDVLWIYSTRGHLRKLAKVHLRRKIYEGI